MKHGILVLCLLLCAVFISGCVGVSDSEQGGIEYQKTVITNPGEHVVIWKNDKTMEIFSVISYSEDYFHTFDDNSIDIAVKENKETLESSLESATSSGYSYYGIITEDIGDGLLLVLSIDKDDISAITIEKEVYLDLYKDDAFFEYPTSFLPIEDVVSSNPAKTETGKLDSVIAEMEGKWTEPSGRIMLEIIAGVAVVEFDGEVYTDTVEHYGMGICGLKKLSSEMDLLITTSENVMTWTWAADDGETTTLYLYRT